MINKISGESAFRQVEDAVGKLTRKDKLRLLSKLQQETFADRWKNILKEIDKKLQKFPITQQEIEEEIAAYRREKDAKSRH